jgi:hypothetical protein
LENQTKVEEIHDEIDKNQHGGIELLPIVTRGCLCELAKKIGFDHPAEKSYDFTNQVQTFRHIWHEGQIVSEAIFLCFNSFKKQTKYLQNFALFSRSFRSFFGRIENMKNCF